MMAAIFITYAAIIWLNNSGEQVQWINTATQTIAWLTSGFIMADGNFSVTGKYLGATITSNYAGIAINGTLMEYAQRAPWSR